MSKKTKAKAARGAVQAQASKRRSADAGILDVIRAKFQQVRDTHDRAERIVVRREAMDLAADNLGLLNDCANKHGATPAMQQFLRGGQTLNAVPLCTYASLSAAQRGAKYMGGAGADGPTWAEWCACDLTFAPAGQYIIDDLERWAEQASTKPTSPDESGTVGDDVEMNLVRQQVRVGDNWHDVTDACCKMLSVLVEARGAWVLGKLLDGRGDHMRNRLPRPVRAIIDTDPKNGYRIKPSLFRP